MSLLESQAQGQADLVQRLARQQWAHVLVGIEVDAEVARDLVPPLRPAAGAIAIGRQAKQRFALVVEFRCQRIELHHLLAQGSKFQVQAGAIRLLHAVQRRQAFGQLLTGCECTRVVLLA
ncbi:hypothetical protein D3C81_1664270 [compost metagenome]